MELRRKTHWNDLQDRGDFIPLCIDRVQETGRSVVQAVALRCSSCRTLIISADGVVKQAELLEIDGWVRCPGCGREWKIAGGKAEEVKGAA